MSTLAELKSKLTVVNQILASDIDTIEQTDENVGAVTTGVLL